jgi:hypothetical protein
MAAAELCRAEAVGAALRFGKHDAQIGVDGRDGIRLRTEALELRMVAIAAGFAAQDGAREQRFAPDGDETLGVEIARMQRPEPRRSTLVRQNVDAVLVRERATEHHPARLQGIARKQVLGCAHLGSGPYW